MPSDDWDNIHELWHDIKKFASTHRNYRFMCADSPGIGYGWIAIREDRTNHSKRWTITMRNMKRTLPTRYSIQAGKLRALIKTAEGRRKLCEDLREQSLPRTRWERLME